MSCAVTSSKNIEIIEKFMRNTQESPLQFPKKACIQEAYDEIKMCEPGALKCSWSHDSHQFAFYISQSGEIISLEFYRAMLKSYFKYAERDNGPGLK